MENSGADGRALNIGSGQPVTIREIAHELQRALGSSLPLEITGKYRAGDIRHCFGDISLATQLLGYQPKTRLKEGIEELVAWLESQHATDSVDAAMESILRRRREPSVRESGPVEGVWGNREVPPATTPALPI